MSEHTERSWQEAVDHLRRAAQELRAAAGAEATAPEEEEAAATRLKDDISRLQQTATSLRSKLTESIEAQRTELASEAERQRAEQAAAQVKASLEEMAGLARRVIDDIGSAAAKSLHQAQPELKSAIGVLEDVAKSAGDWLRVVLESSRRTKPGESRPQQPLDDL